MEAETESAADLAFDRRWWTLAVLCLSLLIVFVGNSSLNVAIPTLSKQLHATESQLQWVVAVYSLVFAGLLFSTGALGDRFGRKGALQLGLVLFLVGAALASEATGMGQLIACRAIMGVAGALIMPSTLSIIINVRTCRSRFERPNFSISGRCESLKYSSPFSSLYSLSKVPPVTNIRIGSTRRGSVCSRFPGSAEMRSAAR